MKAFRNFSFALTLVVVSPLWAGRSFNGSTSVITANGISTALDISTGPETISGWFYINTVTSSDQAMVAHFDVTKSNSQFLVGLGIGSSSQNQVGWQVGCCGAFGPSYGACSTPPTTAKWYPFVMYIDSAGTIYGSPTSGLIVGGGLGCSVYTNFTAGRNAGQSNFTIGAESGTSPLNFAGIVGEIAVWNVLLSTSQMNALLNVCPEGLSAHRMGFPQPVGYFPLWGASGSSTEPDLSGNNNNGTITSATAANHPPCTP